MANEDTNVEQGTEEVNPELKAAVDTASDLLILARDQKTTGITVMIAPEEEVAAVRSFIARGKQQQEAGKKIYALTMAKAKERNAGKKLPPSKQKLKDEADARKAAKASGK